MAVYPRVAGGTRDSPDGSPSGRGNPLATTFSLLLCRSIPEWAGEPVGHGCSSAGLSPSGRGNPLATTFSLLLCRSIPEWAGEPVGHDLFVAPLPVYPRVNQRVLLVGQERDGSIPAWAGEPTAPDHLRKLPAGLSPRRRGNLTGRSRHRLSVRSIPA